MKKIVLMSLLFLCGWISAGAVDLNKENRDPKYVESIVNRSQKIVDKLGLTDAKVAEDVCNVIANRYFELNDIYEIRDAKVKAVKESGLTGDAKNEALKAAENEKDAALYRSHFAFPASLSLFLNEEQIEAVKDGMTYGVVKVTYEATLDMIPSLKEEEKVQIYAWLVEAREFAMDAENSNKKHAAFVPHLRYDLLQKKYDLPAETGFSCQSCQISSLLFAEFHLRSPDIPEKCFLPVLLRSPVPYLLSKNTGCSYPALQISG